MNCKETTLRTVVKTIGFKILTTSITACFTGLGGAIKIHLILTLVYLFYERIWNRIDWGKIYERGIIITKKKISNMSFSIKELEGFPKEVVIAMLENQVMQGNKKKIKVFQNNRDANQDEKGFDWDLTSEGADFWHDVIIDRNFSLFFERFPTQDEHQALFRMNRKGIFTPAKHTVNQCGKQGNEHYEYLLTIIVRNKLDEQGFIIDHDDLNKAIQECPIYGSCEEMQRLIHKKIIEILPDNVLLGYKCVIKPLDFTAQASIEFIECSNPEYFSLL